MEKGTNSVFIKAVHDDTGVFRIIRISADDSLDRLARAILASFDKEYDSFYCFWPDYDPEKEAPDENDLYVDSNVPDGRFYCDKYTLRQTLPGIGKPFMFMLLNEEGAISFECYVTEETEKTTTKPGLIQAAGRSPFDDSNPISDLKYLRRIMNLHPIDFRPDDFAPRAVSEIASMDEGEIKDLPEDIAYAVRNALGADVFPPEAEEKIKKAFGIQ